MSGDEIQPRSEHGLVDVSFVIACYNPGPFLEPAIRSALCQTGVSVEVVVVDDGSTDGSLQMLEQMRAADPRIRVFRTAHNSGPAGARNIGLRHMRGKWYAVLDADDLLLPDRSETLVALANAHQADMVADNIVQFGEGIVGRPMFDIAPSEGACHLTLPEYIRRSRLFGPDAGPGYLKPMIRHTAIERAGLLYNEDLWIAEDDELIIRALSAGLSYVVCGYAGYFYRRHDGSISHRLSLSHLEKMLVAEEAIARALPDDIRDTRAYRARRHALQRGHAFTLSIEALKSRAYFAAIKVLAKNPSAISLYALPISARIRRLGAKPK